MGPDLEKGSHILGLGGGNSNGAPQATDEAYQDKGAMPKEANSLCISRMIVIM